MRTLPLVTVLIPARDEATEIEGCLAAVAAQDYPVNRLEVIVVDGASEDGTASAARHALGRWGFAATAVLVNPDATTPSNLNVGLEHATGSIVCRVDARTRIEPHHVRTCVQVLEERSDVSVVGGAQVAVARDASARAMGIARALNNRWSMGGSAYRRATASGPSDTVYLGAFRTSDLRAVGGWDVRLPTNQDFDLNRRMAALGTVWFDAALRSGYLPRRSLDDLWRQYRRFGQWKVRYWALTRDRPQPRQWAILALPLVVLLCTVGLLWRRPSGLVPFAVAGAAGILVVDAAGAAGQASLAVRMWAAAATAVVSLGWWTGVVAEAARRRPAIGPGG